MFRLFIRSLLLTIKVRSSAVNSRVILKFKSFARLSSLSGLRADKHNSYKFFYLFVYKLFGSVSARFFYLKRLAFNFFVRRAKLGFVFALLRSVASKVALNISNCVIFATLSCNFVITSLIGVNFFFSKNLGARYFLTRNDVICYNSCVAEAAKVKLVRHVTKTLTGITYDCLPFFVLGSEFLARGFVSSEASLFVFSSYEVWRTFLSRFDITSGVLL